MGVRHYVFLAFTENINKAESFEVLSKYHVYWPIQYLITVSLFKIEKH